MGLRSSTDDISPQRGLRRLSGSDSVRERERDHQRDDGDHYHSHHHHYSGRHHHHTTAGDAQSYGHNSRRGSSGNLHRDDSPISSRRRSLSPGRNRSRARSRAPSPVGGVMHRHNNNNNYRQSLFRDLGRENEKELHVRTPAIVTRGIPQPSSLHHQKQQQRRRYHDNNAPMENGDRRR